MAAGIGPRECRDGVLDGSPDAGTVAWQWRGVSVSARWHGREPSRIGGFRSGVAGRMAGPVGRAAGVAATTSDGAVGRGGEADGRAVMSDIWVGGSVPWGFSPPFPLLGCWGCSVANAPHAFDPKNPKTPKFFAPKNPGNHKSATVTTADMPPDAMSSRLSQDYGLGVTDYRAKAKMPANRIPWNRALGINPAESNSGSKIALDSGSWMG